MKKLSIYLFILFAPLGLAAQKGSYKALGDKAFDDNDFYGAANYYLKAATGKSTISANNVPFYSSGKYTRKQQQADQPYVTYRLAECYRLYQDFTNAATWYLKVIGDSKFPLARLHYAICLRASSNYHEALEQLKQFIGSYKGDAKYLAVAQHEIDGCKFAMLQQRNPQAVMILPKEALNGGDGNYALTISNNAYWFTSARSIESNRYLNKIYTTDLKGTSSPRAIDFKRFDKGTLFEYGTPSLNASGTKMYLTRWHKAGDKIVTEICYSNLENSKWQQPQELNLNVNIEGYSARQPFITADGKRLFFASNKPGGQGGDDIWVSDLNNDGQAANAVNLGAAINSAFDEQAPCYDGLHKKLVFSSNGFIGMGGFDLFESDGDAGTWTKPVNMGYPTNSSKDDLYYTIDPKEEGRFYFSSNRWSDCCLSLFTGQVKFSYIAGNVIDCKTQQGLAGVKVTLVDSVTKKTIGRLSTDANGKYLFKLKNKSPYLLELSKGGYFTKFVYPQANAAQRADTLFNPGFCIVPFKINVPILIKDIYYDYDKAILRAASIAELNKLVGIMNDNPKIKIEVGSHTDSIGKDDANLTLSLARAQSCVSYLITNGITPARIVAKGYGETMPVAPNSLPNGKDNPAGRQLNRRTTFTVKSVD
jgi:outer membrane protein OmpA-like peptidoglycan-associated protein